MKMGLAGLALAGTMAAIGSIEGVIANTFKFIKEDIAPGVKRAMTEVKKDFTNFKENVFGKEGFIPIVSSGFKDIMDGFKEGDFDKQVKGLKTIFVDGTVKGIATAGDLAV